MMKYKINRTGLLLETIIKSLKVYTVIIFILTLFRIVFTLYFGDAKLLMNNIGEVFNAFFLGWKYDTIIACYTLIPLLIIGIFLSVLKQRKLTNLLNFLSFFYFFVLINLIVFVEISDLGFYSYFQDHLNILFFGFFEDDTKALLISIWKNYPIEYALIGYGFFIIILAVILKKIFKFIPKNKSSILKGSFVQFSSVAIVVLLLFAGGLRGGYGIMVLSPKYADFSKSQFINQISLNGVITFEKAFKLRQTRTSLDFNMAKSFGYGDDIHKAFSDYLGFDTSPTKEEQLLNLIERKTPHNPYIKEVKPHVIVILMESFGAHWIKYNSESFNFLGDLKKYFEEDYYFKKFISGDNGTIGSLMVMGTNIPQRNGARYISESRYMQVPLKSAAHIPYKENGYETNFLYGGKLAWRDIGKYFTYQGIHNVEGENHIRDLLKLSGEQGTEWGLYDEHFFNFIKVKLENAKRPQFLLGLSTSNHPPFQVPSSFKAPRLILPEALKERISREEDLFMQRFLAFQYANYKLAEFIKWIKTSEFSKNTIIAITGDHNFWGFMNYTKEETFSKYRVPFYLYLPDKFKPNKVDLDKIGSHEDILTTLYNLSLSNTSYLSFGDDLFSSSSSMAINGAIYANDKGVIFQDNAYNWSGDESLIETTQSKDRLPMLRKTYKSTLSIADYFLRKTLEDDSK